MNEPIYSHHGYCFSRINVMIGKNDGMCNGYSGVLMAFYCAYCVYCRLSNDAEIKRETRSTANRASAFLVDLVKIFLTPSLATMQNLVVNFTCCVRAIPKISGRRGLALLGRWRGSITRQKLRCCKRLCILGPRGAIEMCYYYYYY